MPKIRRHPRLSAPPLSPSHNILRYEHVVRYELGKIKLPSRSSRAGLRAPSLSQQRPRERPGRVDVPTPRRLVHQLDVELDEVRGSDLRVAPQLAKETRDVLDVQPEGHRRARRVHERRIERVHVQGHVQRGERLAAVRDAQVVEGEPCDAFSAQGPHVGGGERLDPELGDERSLGRVRVAEADVHKPAQVEPGLNASNADLNIVVARVVVVLEEPVVRAVGPGRAIGEPRDHRERHAVEVARLRDSRRVDVCVRVDPDDGERGIVAERAGDGADGDAVVTPEDQGNRAGRLGVVDASGDELVERRGVGVSPRVCFPDAGHRWRAGGAMRGRGHGRLWLVRVAEVAGVPAERADVVDDAGRAENGGSALHPTRSLPRSVGCAEDRQIFGTPARK
mmetsp:Transcript_14279/g.56355  ORF Transcript_14279/g.56355 Transcript_14279/m.56355 type:complete len:394 (+) Transcript_14279:42-1223(+)